MITSHKNGKCWRKKNCYTTDDDDCDEYEKHVCSAMNPYLNYKNMRQFLLKQLLQCQRFLTDCNKLVYETR